MENSEAIAKPYGPTFEDLPTEICQMIIDLILPYKSNIPARFEDYPSASSGVRKDQQRTTSGAIAYHKYQNQARRSLSIMRTNKRFYADALYLQGKRHSSTTYTLTIYPGDGALNSSGSIFFLGHDYLTPRRPPVRDSPVSKREHRRNSALIRKQAGAIRHKSFLLTHVSHLVIELACPSSWFPSGVLHIREHLTTICRLLQASKALKTLKIENLQADGYRATDGPYSFLHGWQRGTFPHIRPVHGHHVSYDFYLALQPLVLLRGVEVASVGEHDSEHPPTTGAERLELQIAKSLMSKELVLPMQEKELRQRTQDMRDSYPKLRLREVESLLKSAERRARSAADSVRKSREASQEPQRKLTRAENLKKVTATQVRRLNERAESLRRRVRRGAERVQRNKHNRRLYSLAVMKDDERVWQRIHSFAGFADSRGIVVEAEAEADSRVDVEDEDDDGEVTACT